ncbi:hypothetical protein BsWGS_16651 [Bradybaena similaris]
MPRGLRKKTKQYVLDRFQDEDPVEYYKYKTKSADGLMLDQMDIIRALECQSVKTIRSMLNRGVDPNFEIPRTQQTPLHLALKNNPVPDTTFEKMLNLLLFFGANPNAQDCDGISPLHLACMYGNTLGVQLLLQAGADVNVVDNIQETPLMSACKHLSDKSGCIVDLLVAHGADVFWTDHRTRTALHLVSAGYVSKSASVWTVKNRHCLVRTLLRHGLCVNTADEQGLSPLCYELLLLLKSSEHVPCMLDTAKELVCGGAELLLPYDFDALESFIRGLVTRISAPAAGLFSRLVEDIQLVIPRSQTKLLQRLRHRVNSSLATSSLGTDMESAPITVPSLTGLCRIVLKQCLNGYVLANVIYLPVPDKIKDYICSCD